MGKNSKKTKPVAKEAEEKKAKEEELDLELPDKPVLRFSPTAWAKLLYLRDLGDTEVGGFGVSGIGDPLYIEEFITVKQECTSATVEFDDESIADYVEDRIDMGYQPHHITRIWIHTHPSISATPSITDEDTFRNRFGKCGWAVMFILAKGGQTTCRLMMNETIPMCVEIPDEIDFGTYDFAKSNYDAWLKEYKKNITKKICAVQITAGFPGIGGDYRPGNGYGRAYDDKWPKNSTRSPDSSGSDIISIAELYAEQYAEDKEKKEEKKEVEDYGDYEDARDEFSSMELGDILGDFHGDLWIDGNIVSIFESMQSHERQDLLDALKARYALEK